MTAAAAVVLAGVVWLTVGNGSAPSAYAELMQAVENTKGAEWVHWTTQLDQAGLKGTWHRWISLSPFAVYSKLPNGIAQHVDAKLLRIYDPSTKTLTVRSSGEIGKPFENLTLPGLLDAEIALARKHGAKISKSIEDGLLVYKAVRGESTDCYYVDRKTRRILRAKALVQRDTGDKALMTMDFDYPATGPKDIYELGVPRDAKVVDLTAAKQPTTTRAPDAPPSLLELLTEAIQTSKAAEWVHFRLPGESGEMEMWLSFRPHRQFGRNGDGVVYVDGAKRLRHHYDRKTRTLTIKLLTGAAEDLLSQPSFLDLLLAKIEHIQARFRTEITRAEERIDGKQLVVYRYVSEQAGGQDRGEIRVDPATRRVVRMKLSGYLWPKPLEVKFDYPATGPKDIYELGVPRDAKVIDERAADPAATSRPES